MPYAKVVLDLAADAYGATWSDPDLGGASFLSCDAEQQPTLKSVETLIHESLHKLAKDGCLHELTTGRPLCFSLVALPSRSIARITRPPAGFDEGARAALDNVQQLYLDATDQGPLGLFDELMAYRSTSEVTALRLAIPGEIAANVHEYNNLPLFMDLSVRYVLELAKQAPDVAARTFGPATQNRANLIALLDRAEASYQVWSAAMMAAGKRPTVFERVFWDEYQRDRRRWLGSAPLR